MNAEHYRIVVTSGLCPCHAVHTTQVHHRDFPEIWAEGISVEEGAAQLANHLARAQEGARGAWQREEIGLAMADLASFIIGLSEEQASPKPRLEVKAAKARRGRTGQTVLQS
jgi:hypothetical protein